MTGPLDALPPRTGPPPDPELVLDAFVGWTEVEGLTLYPAQEEALLDIVSGANVIVSTPTGSGKSLIALGAHVAAIAAGQRSFYTAPIKALVSEKFFALCRVLGSDHVGMLTGDAAVNPDAPVICCTAEVLANLALREGPTAAVDQVVMDEFHFYADPDRGWAWQVPLLSCRAHSSDRRRSATSQFRTTSPAAPAAPPPMSPPPCAPCRSTSATGAPRCTAPSTTCSPPTWRRSTSCTPARRAPPSAPSR
jgi:hypothetical protein